MSKGLFITAGEKDKHISRVLSDVVKLILESFLQTSDGGYIMVGTTRSYVTGSCDMWLVKTDAKGIAQWNRTFGGEEQDTASSFRQASDGGYIIAGSTESYGAGSYDFWLLKTDPEGTEQWNRTFGGDSIDLLYSFQQTFDGGYILGGYTHSFGTGSFRFLACEN
jgi:outer membrane protein assembly factor BamB